MTKRKPVIEAGAPLSPNDIVRFKDGPRVYGMSPTAIRDGIKLGDIEEPMRLGQRALGWTGQQILDWQARKRSEAAAAAKARSEAAVAKARVATAAVTRRSRES
jgi:predicted DNA-binding transcriptional regulator AlpA